MTQTIAPRLRTLVLLLLAAACALLAGAGPASAHAALTGSDPREGAVVDKAPAQVSLTFSESSPWTTTHCASWIPGASASTTASRPARAAPRTP